MYRFISLLRLVSVMDVSNNMEVSLMLDLAADDSQTVVLKEPGSVKISGNCRVKRNRPPSHLPQKKVYT